MLFSQKKHLCHLCATMVFISLADLETMPHCFIQLYFSTDDTMSAKDVIEYCRTRFQIEFYFRNAKNYAGLCDYQSTDFRKLHDHFNASFTAINLAKAACKSIGIPYSFTTCKSVIHNA